MDSSFKTLKRVSLFLIVCFVFPVGSEAATSSLNLDWTSKLRTGKVASKRHLNFATPVAVSEHVYVGNSGGYFYAVDINRGKKVWEIKLQGPVLSRPLFEAGAIYIGDGKGVVYSINAENGEINWHSYIGEEVMTTPALDENCIYVATQSNSVFALDKSSGAIKWSSSRRLPFSSLTIKGHASPILIDKKIYVGDTDGVLVVYNSANGEKLSTLPLAAGRATFTDIDSSPLREDGKLILSTMEGALYSIDYKTGKEHWSVPIGTPNNIVYRNGLLYVTAAGKAFCLKVDSGETVWEKDLNVPELSEPALSAEYVAVVSTDDKLFLLDISTGDIVLERHLGGGSFGSPIISGGRLLVLTNSGSLCAFRIKEPG